MGENENTNENKSVRKNSKDKISLDRESLEKLSQDVSDK